MKRFFLGAGWILAAVLVVALFVRHPATPTAGACSDTAVATGPAHLSDTVSMQTNSDGSKEARIDPKANGAVCVDAAGDIHIYKEATKVTLDLALAATAANATWGAPPFQVSETPDGLPIIPWPYATPPPTVANGLLTVVLMHEGGGKLRHYWLKTNSGGVSHAADPMIKNH